MGLTHDIRINGYEREHDREEKRCGAGGGIDIGVSNIVQKRGEVIHI